MGLNIQIIGKKIFKLIKRNKAGASYVSLTIATTLLRFFKGFVLMKYLSLSDLGILTLVSVTMGLFTMLQLGFLNGGYRIYCEQHKASKDVNDIVYSYFSIIEVFVIIGIIIMYLSGRLKGIEVVYAFLASFFGILLVLNNWSRNILISQKRVSEVNRLNLISTITAFVFLFSIPFWGLYGALLVTFSIELIFYVLAIWRTRDLFPNKFNFNIKQYKWVLSFGFLPFLAGVISMYNMQVETWSIASYLSTKDLGSFYLPTLYITLFLLIPKAVHQLFYPDTVKAYTEHNFNKVRSVLKKYIFVNASVSIFILVITIFFITPVITFFIPLHLVGVPFVWLILPGLMIYTLRMPLDLVFYAANILKPFLWSSVIGIAFTTISLLTAGFMGLLTLNYVAIVKSLFYIIVSITLLGFYLYNKKLIWKIEFKN